MAVNYKRLVSLYEHFEPREANERLAEAMGRDNEGRRLRDAQGNHARPDVDAKSIDLGRLFCECFGWNEFVACRKGQQQMSEVISRALTEAEGAVSTSSFTNITGQIVYSTTLDAYEAEEFVFTRLIPEVATQFLDGEKIAGITEIGDEVAVRAEGDPYALAGVTEDWVFTPPVKDRGMIVPVTWEAVFADRTNLLLDRCRDVGKWSGVNREKRAIDAFVDENTTVHRYNWRGTTIASYGDNSGTHTWDNLAASNALVDWTDIDVAEQVFNALVDPYTGEPSLWDPKHLVVTKQNEQTARRIVSATEIRVTTPGYATSANPTQSIRSNPYGNKYEVVTSRLLASRLTTDTDWWIGDVSKVAKYMQAEKMNVMQAPTNSHEEFHRRIVQQFRVNERGAYVVVQPRAAVKSTVA
jgi:hypothetical protein